MAKPIALVIGATGTQGGSVARALLDKYHVRTLSRDPSKPAAKAVADLGVEVIKGDLTDTAAVSRALAGADTVFLVTQFWEHLDPEREYREAVPFIDAVAAAGVKHFVFSALEDVAKVTGGAITGVHHFNGKGRLMEYIRSKGMPVVFIGLSFYLENFLGWFKPQAQPDGTYAITLPDMGNAPMNAMAASETGHFVRAILDNWEKYKGQFVPLCTDLRPLDEMCATFSKVLGKKVTYNRVPFETFAAFGFPGAADLSEMFRFYAMGPSVCKRDPATAYELYPAASNVEKWATEHKEELMKAWFGQ